MATEKKNKPARASAVAWGLGAAAVAGAGALGAWLYWGRRGGGAAPQEEGDGMQATGIDVSRYQATVDWARVAASGVSFAFIKCSEADFVDSRFAENWGGAKRAGVIRGAYHFFRADKDPLAQARLFTRTAVREAGDLPHVVDAESPKYDGVTASQYAAKLRTCMAEVERATGATPILYTYTSFWRELGNPADFARFPLWLADYEKAIHIPATWGSDWSFWQHSNKGAVPGISGDVDLNIFNGTLAELRAFCATNNA